MKKCDHRRIKKNYPYGHKSAPTMFCKDCGKIIKPIDLKIKKPKRRQRKMNKEKRNKRINNIILIMIFVVLLSGNVIQSVLRIKEAYVYKEVKEEFGEYMLYQVELFNFCVEKGELDFQETLDDFVRWKVEEIIQETKLKDAITNCTGAFC